MKYKKIQEQDVYVSYEEHGLYSFATLQKPLGPQGTIAVSRPRPKTRPSCGLGWGGFAVYGEV